MVRLALLLAVLAACTDDVTVKPVIDVPVGDDTANAFQSIEEVIITVAHEGSDRDLVSASFERGQPIDLTGAPFGDDLVVHMNGFVGASNTAYGRTCAFAVDPSTPPPAPHLFFSVSGKFASLGVDPEQRSGGIALPYLGTALILGGGSPVVERFDPTTGALASVGALEPRTGAAFAPIGTNPPEVVVLGGAVDENTGASFVERVDPAHRIERIDSVIAPIPRVGITATTLTDGRVVAIGGHEPKQPPVGTISELTLDTSVEVRTLHAELAHPRTDHTATRLGDDLGAPVLVVGGTDATGAPVAIAELLKPLAESLADPAKFAPAMITPRWHHQAVLMPDGSVLVIGGLAPNPAGSGDPVTVASLERFTLDGGFEDAGSLPAGLVDFTATSLPDGRVLITGGRNTATGLPTTTAYIARLDPLDNSVDIVPTDRLAAPRAGHQAVLMCDGTVLVTGGTDGPAAAERYNPPPAGRR